MPFARASTRRGCKIKSASPVSVLSRLSFVLSYTHTHTHFLSLSLSLSLYFSLSFSLSRVRYRYRSIACRLSPARYVGKPTRSCGKYESICLTQKGGAILYNVNILTAFYHSRMKCVSLDKKKGEGVKEREKMLWMVHAIAQKRE